MADGREDLGRIPQPEEAPIERPSYPRAPGYVESGYGYGYGEEEGRNRLHELWRTVRKHKWLIVTIAVVVTSVVTVEAYRARPVFSASAIIELGKDNTTMIKSNTGDVVIQTDDTDLYYPEMSIKTKMLKLTSEPLLEDVVLSLKLDKNPKFADVGGKKSYWSAFEALGSRVS